MSASLGATLSFAQRAAALELAREAIEAELTGRRRVAEPEVTSLLRHLVLPVFVTVRGPAGELRGCFGCLEAESPLPDSLGRLAVAAATRDSRFVPIHVEEVSEIEIEVTVLGPFAPVGGPREVTVGRHGLYVRLGSRSGVLLPQVAVERGWSGIDFVDQVCLKARLDPRRWREYELFVFEAEHFRERERSS